MGAAWLVFRHPPSRRSARTQRSGGSTTNANAGVAAATLVGAALVLDARGWSTPWGPHGKIGATVCALVAVRRWRVLEKILARPTGPSGIGSSASGRGRWGRTTAPRARRCWRGWRRTSWERPAWALLLAWIAVGAWAEWASEESADASCIERRGRRWTFNRTLIHAK